MIKILLQAHLYKHELSGYTNKDYKIQWMDYRRYLGPVSQNPPLTFP